MSGIWLKNEETYKESCVSITELEQRYRSIASVHDKGQGSMCAARKIISIIALAIKLSYFCSRSVAMSCPNYFGKIYAWPKTEIPEVDRLFVYIEFKVATSSSLFKVAVSH